MFVGIVTIKGFICKMLSKADVVRFLHNFHDFLTQVLVVLALSVSLICSGKCSASTIIATLLMKTLMRLLILV